MIEATPFLLVHYIPDEDTYLQQSGSQLLVALTQARVIVLTCERGCVIYVNMDIWRRNIRRRIEFRPTVVFPPPPPPYPFNDVIVNSEIPEYRKFEVA